MAFGAAVGDEVIGCVQLVVIVEFIHKPGHFVLFRGGGGGRRCGRKNRTLLSAFERRLSRQVFGRIRAWLGADACDVKLAAVLSSRVPLLSLPGQCIIVLSYQRDRNYEKSF